jgi:hypothetical protein
MTATFEVISPGSSGSQRPGHAAGVPAKRGTTLVPAYSRPQRVLPVSGSG